MKINLTIIAVNTATLYLSSCSKENESLAPQNIISTTSDQGVNENLQRKSSQRQFSAPFIGVPLPCGYGFKLGLNPPNQGSQIQFPYEVWLNGQFQFSGTIMEGQNTDWISNPLTPCTDYVFKFWGYGIPFGVPTNEVTVTSDGCGGIFIC
ncbi:MAG: hypothetical protein JKY48_11315 [Flavobacteriales bacterium]|nr:hypothetical protein [Flavobacteriales bacterium]